MHFYHDVFYVQRKVYKLVHITPATCYQLYSANYISRVYFQLAVNMPQHLEIYLDQSVFFPTENFGQMENPFFSNFPFFWKVKIFSNLFHLKFQLYPLVILKNFFFGQLVVLLRKLYFIFSFNKLCFISRVRL